jgi:alanyl aminopeptidase
VTPTIGALLLSIALLESAAPVAEPAPSAKPARAPAATPAALRLGDAVRPVRYAIDMTLIPTERTFRGRVDVDVVVKEATDLVRLHASGITVRSAEVSGRPARIVPAGDDVIGLALDTPVPPGAATLHIDYEGPLPDTEDAGIYRQEEEGDWYVFTQFEATDARRAFPCFDEPAFKVPWQLTLHVKREHLAFSNAPVASETEEAGGLKAVRFAETKPMPSYLLAIAVGPFDVVDAGTAGRAATPIRIITPRGKGAEAKWAAAATGPILVLLERYFGSPYPFEKLDSIAVPQKGGAMENPGLVTYGQRILLSKAEEDTISRQRGYANTCAHELAHMWFGDLVTMEWWDDIWLNEAFATWMARRIVDEWKPEWGGDVGRVTSRSGAMTSDGLVTARRIRQPIETHHDIENAFDGITYGKGAAVLFMFEAWLGDETLREGIRRHLSRHAWKNATAADFLAAVSAEAGFDVAPAFSTFLDQPGAPVVTVGLACGEGTPPKLTLAQARYLPEGSQGDADHAWHVPIAVEFGGAASGGGRERAMLTTRTGELVLSGAKACPEWVLANDGEIGYYRARYEGDLLGRLLADGGKRLTLPERVGVVGDVRALVDSGAIPPGEALALVPRLADDGNRHVQSAIAGIVESVSEHLVPDELRPNYQRFVRKTFGARARELGFAPRPGDDEDTRLLRRTLVELVGSEGEDPALVAEAGTLARRWLDDRSAVDPEMVEVVLGLAAENGDRALFDRLRAEARKTEDRKLRGRLLSAMGSFRDPEIAKAALAIVLTDEFEIREAMSLFWGPLRERRTRPLAYAFFTAHHDAMAAKLPRDSRSRMIRVGGVFCDRDHRAEIARFFESRAPDMPGGPRVLAQVLERIDLCTAQVAVQQPSVAAFLREY